MVKTEHTVFVIMTYSLTLTCLLLTLPVALSASQVLVLSPQPLVTLYPQGISHKLATFGQFPYGSYVYGKLIAVVQDGCSVMSSSLQGNIYLIKRGTCDFTKKVLNAERAGAKAVIIYNSNTDNSLLLMGSRPTSVTIPSLFITYADGMALIKADEVYLNLTFTVTPKPSASFGFVFSLSVNDTMLAQVLPSAKVFHVDTRPIFAITRCENCSSFQKKYPNCLAGGRYCAPNSDSNSLKEAIRQQCIYSFNHSAYLPYLEKWFNDCNRDTISVCQAGLVAAGVRAADVQSCLDGSYQGDIEVDSNTVLSDLFSDYQQLQIQGIPTVTLWDDTYFGELTDNYVQRAICAYQSNALQACVQFQCSPGCWNDMKNNGVCDVACNNTLCAKDSGSCEISASSLNCSFGCSERMRTSGQCYSECNTEQCGYGNGTCLCAPGCTPALLSNDACDSVCNYKNCSFDGGLCETCSPGCTGAMMKSGNCFSQCNTKACNYSNWNCRCAAECTTALLLNSQCDQVCNTSRCNYDNYLCLECSPGCTGEMLLDNECNEVCDTLSCNYSNWNCRCSEKCTLELQENDECDSVCNNKECEYDSHLCVINEGDDSRFWVKPVIISLSGLGGL